MFLEPYLSGQSMTQPNFRDMVGMVSFWALACKDHLEYQAKHGKPPLYPELVCPFSQLYSVAGMTLGFADSHWPTGVAGSKVHNDLFATLRPIANQGGLNATIADLKRIAGLAQKILCGGAVVDPANQELAETNTPLGLQDLAKTNQPLGLSGWKCPNGTTIKVAPQLGGPLEAYHNGKDFLDLGGCDKAAAGKIKTNLKKLIRRARDNDYKPDPKRWPRSEKLDFGGYRLWFDAGEHDGARDQGKGEKALPKMKQVETKSLGKGKAKNQGKGKKA